MQEMPLSLVIVAFIQDNFVRYIFFAIFDLFKIEIHYF